MTIEFNVLVEERASRPSCGTARVRGSGAGTMTQHPDIVVDQFTQQATPFAASTAMRDEEALKLLVEFSGAGADDTVLDVACGPGLVVGPSRRPAAAPPASTSRRP